MRRLLLSADYLDFSLRDEVTQEFDRGTLPNELLARLARWNRDYQFVIPLDANQRSRSDVAARIAELDERGRELAEAIVQVVSDVGRVRYYSEGRLGYLD